jgi:ABC-type transporter MlaC component
MKKVLTMLFFLVISCAIHAQSYKRKTPEEKARKYTDELIAVIPVDKDQEEKIFEINVIVSKQFDSLYANKPENSNDMRKAYAVIFKTRDAAFKKVLTKEQFLRYDDWQRELREERMKKKAEKEQQDIENKKAETN